MSGFFDYFTDPVLRGPTWGTFLMCVASSLVGVILLLKRRCLLSETLSHASYPGIIIGVSIFALLFPQGYESALIAILIGAFCSSFLGLKAIEWMETRGKVRSDAALCFILAVFFGAGTVAASAMQHTLPSWRSHLQTLLFGQAATMSDIHILLYAILTGLIVSCLCLVFRPLQVVLFDADYAKTSGLSPVWIERVISWLILLVLILGIRSVGIVLMSGMAIAPAIAARQFTDRLKILFCLAALFGGLSGLIGNILSVEGTMALSREGVRLAIPTGPMIILSSAAIALLALLFSPKKGCISCMRRASKFRFRCVSENILKSMWKKGIPVSFRELKGAHPIFFMSLFFCVLRLIREGWVEKKEGRYVLSADGKRKASSIVRVHRLWELYLVSELGISQDKIHPTAEEMEHILTPEIEKILTRLLDDPKVDPHFQPIPERVSL